MAIAADVTDERAIQDLARQVVERFGRIDVWINNAAVTLFARFEQTPPEAYRKSLRRRQAGGRISWSLQVAQKEVGAVSPDGNYPKAEWGSSRGSGTISNNSRDGIALRFGGLFLKNRSMPARWSPTFIDGGMKSEASSVIACWSNPYCDGALWDYSNRFSAVLDGLQQTAVGPSARNLSRCE
jgi:hypothetical protein